MGALGPPLGVQFRLNTGVLKAAACCLSRLIRSRHPLRTEKEGERYSEFSELSGSLFLRVHMTLLPLWDEVNSPSLSSSWAR